MGPGHLRVVFFQGLKSGDEEGGEGEGKASRPGQADRGKKVRNGQNKLTISRGKQSVRACNYFFTAFPQGPSRNGARWNLHSPFCDRSETSPNGP